jgi:hypothetical protein
MQNNRNQPQPDDAVLGGQHPAPIGAMVLGGLNGVKVRLTSPVVEYRITALSEALRYGVDGLDLVIESLRDRSCKVRHAAYLLLENRTETRVQHALRFYNSHHSLVNRVIEIEPLANLSHIDTMMQSLEEEGDKMGKIVDQSLSLVQTPEGQNRIKHYLFNGTQKQKDYATRYFKDKGRKDILVEAYQLNSLKAEKSLSS